MSSLQSTRQQGMCTCTQLVHQLRDLGEAPIAHIQLSFGCRSSGMNSGKKTHKIYKSSMDPSPLMATAVNYDLWAHCVKCKPHLWLQTVGCLLQTKEKDCFSLATAVFGFSSVETEQGILMICVRLYQRWPRTNLEEMPMRRYVQNNKKSLCQGRLLQKTKKLYDF